MLTRYTLKAKNFGHKNFGQNIFGRFSKLFRTFPEKFRTNTKKHTKSTSDQVRIRIGPNTKKYLVIFNALKIYLKVNSFKFV